MVYIADLKSAVARHEGSSPSTRTNIPRWRNWYTHYVEVVGFAGSSPALGTKQFASADGAVPGLLNQVMGVRISPEAPEYS